MALGLTLGLGLAGCALPGGPRGPEPTDWQAMALSWEKLDAIEVWIDERGSRATVEQVLEAELELAEGRLAFAKADHERDSAAPVDARLDSAAKGFEGVRASENATAEQRERAEQGLAAIARVHVTPIAASAQAATGSVPFVPRSAWGAAPAAANRMTAASQNWSRITIHHTAMPAEHLRGADVGSVGRELRTIQAQHMEGAIDGQAWGDIGYHFLIDPDGRVYEGRRLTWQGAHASGRNNVDNIGICLLGNFMFEQPNAGAIRSLESLIADLRARYGIAADALYGHQHFKGTECPGTHLARWLVEYRRRGPQAQQAQQVPLSRRAPRAAADQPLDGAAARAAAATSSSK